MKCTKCGFISFDFNQVCPRCNRGLADEQRGLNLPSFRPDPPMLLGRLIGEAYHDADVEIMTDQPISMEDSFQPAGADLENSFGGMEDEELSFEDEEELDEITLGLEDHAPSSLTPEAEEAEKDSFPDLDEISFEESEDIVPSGEPQEEDVLELQGDGEDLTLDESMIEQKRKEESEEEDITFDLDDISFEDLDSEGAAPAAPDMGLTDETTGDEEIPVLDSDSLKDGGTMDSFYLDSDAEGLTKEIDMKKFRKDLGKGDKEQ